MSHVVLSNLGFPYTYSFNTTLFCKNKSMLYVLSRSLFYCRFTYGRRLYKPVITGRTLFNHLLKYHYSDVIMTVLLGIYIVPNFSVVSQLNPMIIPKITQFSQKLCLKKEGVALYWCLHIISYSIEFSHYDLQSGKTHSPEKSSVSYWFWLWRIEIAQQNGGELVQTW